MTRIVLDEQMRSQLGGGAKAMELCDETGTTVGHYLPREDYQRLVYDWANSCVTDEELERSLQDPGGKSLAEIMAKLQQA